MLVKQLCCCHLLSARCICSFQCNNLLEIFLFLSNNCQKTGNMRTVTEIVYLCVGGLQPETFLEELHRFKLCDYFQNNYFTKNEVHLINHCHKKVKVRFLKKTDFITKLLKVNNNKIQAV